MNNSSFIYWQLLCKEFFTNNAVLEQTALNFPVSFLCKKYAICILETITVLGKYWRLENTLHMTKIVDQRPNSV